MSLRAVQTLSHLDWIILLAVQRQVRNPKHGRPPIPAAQIAAEASESDWMLQRLGKWHMSPASPEHETQTGCISNIQQRRRERMNGATRHTIGQELQQKHPDLSDISNYDPHLCSVTTAAFRSFTPCIVLMDRFMSGNSWQAERAAVEGEKEKNADLMLQISKRARVQITTDRAVRGKHSNKSRRFKSKPSSHSPSWSHIMTLSTSANFLPRSIFGATSQFSWSKSKPSTFSTVSWSCSCVTDVKKVLPVCFCSFRHNGLSSELAADDPGSAAGLIDRLSAAACSALCIYRAHLCCAVKTMADPARAPHCYCKSDVCWKSCWQLVQRPRTTRWKKIVNDIHV